MFLLAWILQKRLRYPVDHFTTSIYTLIWQEKVCHIFISINITSKPILKCENRSSIVFLSSNGGAQYKYTKQYQTTNCYQFYFYCIHRRNRMSCYKNIYHCSMAYDRIDFLYITSEITMSRLFLNIFSRRTYVATLFTQSSILRS